MSNELAGRLHRAAPTPTREITVAALERATRQRRRRTVSGGASLTLVAVAALLVGLLRSSGSPSDRATIAVVPSAASSSPTGPQTLVSPSTGLVDKQKVTVRGSGFAVNANLAIVTCGAESKELADKAEACATEAPGYVTADPTGAFSMSYVVQRSITTPKTGRIDCAVKPGRCRIGVGEVSSGKGASALLTFRADLPRIPTPAVRLQAAGQLRDGSLATVLGTGFGADRQVTLSECLTNSDCGGYGVVHTAIADAQGNFTALVTLREKISILGGGQAWCALNCLLFAQAQPDTSQVTAVTPSFSLEPPVPSGGLACTLSLKVSYGGLRATKRGAHLLAINLKNAAPTPCWLNGYPNVQLDLLTGPASGTGYFVGTGANATGKIGSTAIIERPRWIRLDPEGSAHFQLLKDDCASGGSAIANFVSFSLSGGNQSSEVRLPASDAALALPFCQNHSTNVFHIGPFVVGTG